MLFPIHIKHPNSLWIQLSSLSFVLAGNFSDLLIIRICLSMRYFLFLINCIVGVPLWPALFTPSADEAIQLDGMIWALINLYVHLSTVVRLLNDERTIELCNDQQALWRMFYRTGGLSPKLFHTLIASYCTTITASQKDFLNTDDYFYIIYDGAIHITMTDSANNDAVVATRIAVSGQIFDYRALGILLGQYNSQMQYQLTAVVLSKTTKLFRFRVDQMPTIVTHPSTRLIWKKLLMETLFGIVERYLHCKSSHTSTIIPSMSMIQEIDNQVDPHINMSRTNYGINPIFDVLRKEEEPNPLRAGSNQALRNPFAHIVQYMVWSFTPPWPFHGPPVGIRHSQLLLPDATTKLPKTRQLQHISSTLGEISITTDHQNVNTTPTTPSPTAKSYDEMIEASETTPLNTTISYQSIGGTDERRSNNDHPKSNEILSLDYINDLDEERGSINYITSKSVSSIMSVASSTVSLEALSGASLSSSTSSLLVHG